MVSTVKWTALTAGLLLLLMSTGCATVVTGRGPDQSVRINSIPTGAQVYVNGNSVGMTPTSVSLTRQDDHHIRIELDGYRPYERHLNSNWNPWMLGNIPIFFPVGTLIGVLIDFHSDADRWLHPRRISVNLVREGGEASTTGHQVPPSDAREAGETEVETIPDPGRSPPEQ